MRAPYENSEEGSPEYWGGVPALAIPDNAKTGVNKNAVQVSQRWIVAALRHRKFFSLEQANQAIRELLDRLNHRPFRKREGSRASVFEALDKPAATATSSPAGSPTRRLPGR